MKKNKYSEIDAFRVLDPAPETHLKQSEQIRADAGLQRILASDPNNGNGVQGIQSKPPARRKVLPIAAAAVAVLTATAVLLPVLGNEDAAYASWEATPTSISATDNGVADAACRGRLQLSSPQLDLSERRGDWVVMLYTGAEHMAGMCLAHLPIGAAKAKNVDVSQGGGDQGFLPVDGEFTQGNIAEFRGGNAFGGGNRPEVSLTHGNVGENVAAVMITTPDGHRVHATVQDGRYAAWWPGKAFGDETEGNGGPAPAISYTITLNDQTVIENATPRMPS